MKIRTGDTVLIISGKDRGKTGSVMRVLTSQNRLIVTGINMRTKHVKKTAQQAGQKLTFEASIHASNVMILDPKSKKPSRIGYKVTEKGKVRVSKESGTEVPKAATTVAPKVKKAAAVQKEKVKAETQEQEEKKPQEKKPFWKNVSFGSAAIQASEKDEGSHMQEDHSIPAQEQHIRKGGRGV